MLNGPCPQQFRSSQPVVVERDRWRRVRAEGAVEPLAGLGPWQCRIRMTDACGRHGGDYRALTHLHAHDPRAWTPRKAEPQDGRPAAAGIPRPSTVGKDQPWTALHGDGFTECQCHCAPHLTDIDNMWPIPSLRVPAPAKGPRGRYLIRGRRPVGLPQAVGEPRVVRTPAAREVDAQTFGRGLALAVGALVRTEDGQVGLQHARERAINEVEGRFSEERAHAEWSLASERAPPQHQFLFGSHLAIVEEGDGAATVRIDRRVHDVCRSAYAEVVPCARNLYVAQVVVPVSPQRERIQTVGRHATVLHDDPVGGSRCARARRMDVVDGEGVGGGLRRVSDGQPVEDDVPCHSQVDRGPADCPGQLPILPVRVGHVGDDGRRLRTLAQYGQARSVVDQQLLLVDARTYQNHQALGVSFGDRVYRVLHSTELPGAINGDHDVGCRCSVGHVGPGHNHRQRGNQPKSESPHGHETLPIMWQLHLLALAPVLTPPAARVFSPRGKLPAVSEESVSWRCEFERRPPQETMRQCPEQSLSDQRPRIPREVGVVPSGNLCSTTVPARL